MVPYASNKLFGENSSFYAHAFGGFALKVTFAPKVFTLDISKK